MSISCTSNNAEITAQKLFFGGEEYKRHHHLLHRYSTVLEGRTIVADMAIGVVVIDEKIVVIGKDVTGGDV